MASNPWTPAGPPGVAQRLRADLLTVLGDDSHYRAVAGLAPAAVKATPQPEASQFPALGELSSVAFGDEPYLTEQGIPEWAEGLSLSQVKSVLRIEYGLRPEYAKTLREHRGGHVV